MVPGPSDDDVDGVVDDVGVGPGCPCSCLVVMGRGMARCFLGGGGRLVFPNLGRLAPMPMVPGMEPGMGIVMGLLLVLVLPLVLAKGFFLCWLPLPLLVLPGSGWEGAG